MKLISGLAAVALAATALAQPAYGAEAVPPTQLAGDWSTTQLTGGAGANLIDASGFTNGGVVLVTGGGLDTLKGGSGDDEFRIDVSGLTTPTSAIDTAHQVKVDTGAGTNDVFLLGLGSTIDQSSLWWVQYLGAAGQFVVTFPGKARPGRNATRCVANLVIDGRRAEFQEFLMMRPREIAAVEVYPRAFSAPQQFIRDRECGALVVWSEWMFRVSRPE